MQFDGQHPWRSKRGSLMPKAWDALAVTHQAVVAMGNARDIRAIEVAWNQVLTNLDIVENQATTVVPDTGPVAGWWGMEINVRKTDELLRYIAEARDNLTHNKAPALDRKMGQESIIVQPTTPGGVTRLEHSSPGYDFGSPLGPGGTFKVSEGVTQVFHTPASIKPLPVVNRGVTYPLPTQHLGTKLPGNELIHLAGLAFAWYQTLLLALEVKLNSDKEPQWMVLGRQYEEARQQHNARIRSEGNAKP